MSNFLKAVEIRSLPLEHNQDESMAEKSSFAQREGTDEGGLETAKELRGPSPNQIKLSPRDVLAMLAPKRIDLTDIKFTGEGPQDKGGMGDVLVATIVPRNRTVSDSGTTVAVKQLRLSETNNEEKFLRVFINELRVVDGLCHPNIVKLIGFVEDMRKRICWLVFPWEANGNVRQFLLSGEWELPERVSLIRDVASGLEYLHTRQPPICHGDLKSLNILVNSDFRAVIADFGSARTVRDSHDAEGDPSPGGQSPNHHAPKKDGCHELTLSASNTELTLTGPSWSFRWASPEMLHDERPTLASDIWALGWIAWEVMTDNYPFPEAKNEHHITVKVMTGQLPAIYKNDQLSQVAPLCRIIAMCWKSEPKDRSSAGECHRALKWIPSVTPAVKSGEKSKIRSTALLLEIGEIHRVHSRNEEASRVFEEGLAIARSTGDKLGIVAFLCKLGDVHRTRSHNTEANDYYTEALNISTRVGDESGRAKALRQLGEIHSARANYSQAETFYKQALEICVSLSDELGQADGLSGLGCVYQRRSNSTIAEEYFTQALRIYVNIGNDRGRANVLYRLGGIYQERSKHAEAEDFFARALNIYISMGDNLGQAHALRRIGDIHTRRANYSEAEECINEALRIFKNIEHERGHAIALFQLGTLHGARSYYAQEEEFYSRALRIYINIGDYLGQVSSSLMLRKIRLGQGRLAEARSFTNDVAEVLDQINYPGGKEFSKILLAEVLAAENSSTASLPFTSLQV